MSSEIDKFIIFIAGIRWTYRLQNLKNPEEFYYLAIEAKDVFGKIPSEFFALTENIRPEYTNQLKLFAWCSNETGKEDKQDRLQG